MLDDIITVIIIMVPPCLCCLLICYLFDHKEYKSKSYVTFLKDKCHIDIHKDIKEYFLDSYEEESIIHDACYLVVACVIPSIFLEVIIKVDGLDYATGNRLKGYLLLQYYCQPEKERFQFFFQSGKGVVAKTKLGQKAPYCSWFTDRIKFEDARKYFKKQEKLNQSTDKQNRMERLKISHLEDTEISITYLNLIMGTGVELDRNRQREELYHLLSNITIELLLKTNDNLEEVNPLYFLLETMEEINDLYNIRKAYLAGKFSKQRNIEFHIGFNHYCNNVSNLARESNLFATQEILYNEICLLLGDKKQMTAFFGLWRKTNGYIRDNIDYFFKLGYEYELLIRDV